MQLGLLAASLLILATTSATAGGGTTLEGSSRTGLWSHAANLSTGREEHTATLLRNRKVLVAGGTDGRGKVLASAELYDPLRNRWTPAGSMRETRVGHTATLLPNGKVLVAGGLVMPFPAPSLATSELYDPATNAWSIGAPMIESRTRHTATPLPDGRVLVVGGLNVTLHDGGLFPSQPQNAEIYDPTANRWSTTAPVGFRRLGQTATLLPDGRVLVAGGQDDSGRFLTSTEIYDAAQDRWISAAPMATARFGHVATLMPDSDVLVAGGLGEVNIGLTSAELYDPRSNLWVTVASMGEYHSAATATLLRTGLVLVVGATGAARAELYDVAHNRWSHTGPSMDRYQHSATRLSDGRVLIVGGYGIDAFKSSVVYDPTAVAPVPRRPPDPQMIAAVLLTALLVVAATGWSIPSIRLRLERWRPPRESEEWIA